MFTDHSIETITNRVIPPWHLFVIVSDISSGNIYGIIFWHSILAFYLTFYSGILSGIYSDILSGILCGIYTDIFSGILSGIVSAICSGIRSGMLSVILFWHSIWHLFWDSFLAFYLVYLRRFFVVEVRHSDPELTVEVRQVWRRKEEEGGGRRRAGWHKIQQPSPDRWGKNTVR